MADELDDLRAVMARLRAECRWKAAQTHTSLTRYLLEEAHETLEAIETGTDDDLREELGDLLLQVFFHAAIAEEQGRFTIDDVAAGIAAKMRRRNPHVFAPGSPTADSTVPPPADPAEVNELWESVKATEKRRDSLLDGVPSTLPALLLADKVLDRRARAGAPPPPGPSYVLVPGRSPGPDTVASLADALRGTGRPVVVAGDQRPRAGDRVVVVVAGDDEPDLPSLATDLDVEVVVTVHLDAGPTRDRPSGSAPVVFLDSRDSPAATAAVVAAVADGLAGRASLADRLLALVGEARAQGLDAEQALRTRARALALEAQTDR